MRALYSRSKVRSNNPPSRNLNMSSELLPDSEGRDDVRLLTFMNRVPPLDEPIAWATGFRDALVELLGDVDRISVTVNLESFDLEHRLTYGHTYRWRVNPIVINRLGTDGPAHMLAAAAADAGFPINDYHTPSVFTYSAGEGTYLGAIILWRLRTRTPVSEQSLQLLNDLRPYITFRMFECVARMVRDERVERSIGSLAALVSARVGFTTRQREVFALAATGMSIGAIAARLGMLPAIVRRSLQGIYKRAGSADVGEIFRRFVAPAKE